MNLKEEYKSETGRMPTFSGFGWNVGPTFGYVEWLESKVNQQSEALHKAYAEGFEAGTEYGKSAAYEG